MRIFRALLQPKRIIALRSEDPSRVWERRACLTPSHVGALTANNIQVLVQPSDRRCFRDHDYQLADAHITPDIQHADLILGVKEPPATDLERYARPGQKWISFWHCHKGQGYNMPLLKRMLDSGADYLDWELLVDAEGNRTTAFGYLAGYAGLCEGLSQLAIKALSIGTATPLLYLPRPYMHPTLEDLNHSLATLGQRIQLEGTGAKLGPVVVAVVGRGRVARGAIDALNQVGVQWVSPQALRSFVQGGMGRPHNKLYAVQFTLEDYVRHKDGLPFERDEYRKSPLSFKSVFATEYAPYITMLHNGAFWCPDSPRLMSEADYVQLHQSLQASGANDRFLQVADVSADWAGGLEFVKRASTIDQPALHLDELGQEVVSPSTSVSPTSVMSIEILPSELPVAASQHFSDSSFAYIRSLCGVTEKDSQAAEQQHATSLENAHLIRSGRLQPQHAWLSENLSGETAAAPSSSVGNKRKKVVLFGSGLVAGPAVTQLTHRGYELTIASNDLTQARLLGNNAVSCVKLELSDTEAVSDLVKAHDCAISLLPASLHIKIAESCIANRTHLVTASYESSEMDQLRSKAQEAGVIIINELGLDPGLDVISAMQMIEAARAAGRTVTSFVSLCGGLPAPEDSGVPLGYKFSWSPRGVLTAAGNNAKYLLNGQMRSIPGDKLLSRCITKVPTVPGFDLEMLANRDSTAYITRYGLDATHLKTIFRGTLRYRGFSQLLESFRSLGMASTKPLPVKPKTWLEVLSLSMATASTDSPNQMLASVEVVDHALHWLGLIPDALEERAMPALPPQATCPLDYLEALLAAQLSYGQGERDLVLLQNELTSTDAHGRSHTDTAALTAYGEAMPVGPTAMAQTVGLPVALGASLVVDGLFSEAGVHTPAHPGVWKPLLHMLEERGIQFKHSRKQQATEYDFLSV